MLSHVGSLNKRNALILLKIVMNSEYTFTNMRWITLLYLNHYIRYLGLDLALHRTNITSSSVKGFQKVKLAKGFMT